MNATQRKANRMQQARELAERVKTLGLAYEIRGNWIEFPPAIPVDILIAASECADELVEVFSKETQA